MAAAYHVVSLRLDWVRLVVMRRLKAGSGTRMLCSGRQMVSQRSGRSLLSIPLPLSQSHTGSAAVLIDEFDASALKSALQFLASIVRDPRTEPTLQSLDGRQ